MVCRNLFLIQELRNRLCISAVGTTDTTMGHSRWPVLLLGRWILRKRLLLGGVTATVCIIFPSLIWVCGVFTSTHDRSFVSSDGGYPCRLEAPHFSVDLKTHNLKSSSMIIARSTVLRQSDGFCLKMLVLETCESSKQIVRVQVNGRQVFCTSAIHVVDEECPWRWAESCEWTSFALSALLPEEPSNIRVFRGNNSITLNYEKIRQHGDLRLVVCIQPLYWFVDWLQIIEFIEAWKSQGADHFFFYYHIISEQTMKILRYYESTGSVTLIPWKSFPSSVEVDPNESVYRLAHALASNDCLHRALVAQFVATSVYKLLQYKDRRCSSCGGYVIAHAKLYYSNRRPSGEFRWADMTMEWLSNSWATVPDVRGPRKLIYRPERIGIVSVHGVRKINPNYVIIRLKNSEAALFHARHTWIDRMPVDDTLIPNVIPSSVRYRIHSGYEDVMNEIMAFNRSATVVLDLSVQKRVQRCIGRLRFLTDQIRRV
uniref:Glycosyltransferase family 92 protein n=1 Tax=Ascaris lumbricoides TaxID=6252 RepID=A0A0M3ICS8_ASCLU